MIPWDGTQMILGEPHYRAAHSQRCVPSPSIASNLFDFLTISAKKRKGVIGASERGVFKN
jgi:hypothetical protein